MESIIDFQTIKSLGDLFVLFREKNIPKEQYWYYMNMYQNSKARDRGIPLDGLFELTPFCNLDCKMCYVHLEKTQLKGHSVLSVEQWKHIIKEAADAGMIRATLTGGECLVYPGFEEIYLYLQSLGVSVSIKTNGVLINKDKVDFFKKNPPNRINVSLYGSSDDTYEKVTGSRVFSKVFSNLKCLKEAELPVLISITPSLELYDDLDNILHICKELDIPFIVNRCLYTPRENTGREVNDLSISQYVEVFRKVNAILGNKLNPIEESELPEFGRASDEQFGIRCGAGKCNFDVQWNGVMTPCVNIHHISENLIGADFTKAWNRVHEAVRQMPTVSECSECSYKLVCSPCIATHEIKDGHAICNRKVCEKTKAFAKAGFYSSQLK